MDIEPIIVDLDDGDRYVISSQRVHNAPDNVYLYVKDDMPADSQGGAVIKLTQETLKNLIQDLQVFVEEK